MSGQSSGASTKKSGTLFGRIFGSSNNNSKEAKFGSFNTGKYPNGESVVKGNNFEQYMSDYNDYDSFSYQSLGDDSYIETISPGNIEGIRIGSTEMEDSGRFWSQHDNEGTADSFKEIASHIPEVKSQIDSGKSLTEIRNDPSLEKCVDIYFDPSNVTRVIKNNGYYEFESNGRHRVLAARELGFDIPVKIVGIRTRK